MTATVAFLAVAAGFAIVIALLLRSGKLKEKYTALWLIVGLGGIGLALAPEALGVFARLVGIALPSNLLFAMAILLVLSVTLHLSLEVSRLEVNMRRLAEEAAILRQAVESGQSMRAIPMRKSRAPGEGVSGSGQADPGSPRLDG